MLVKKLRTTIILIIITSLNLFGATSFSELQKLSTSDLADGDSFGFRVSIDDDHLVVGAYREDGAGTDRGAAYVFKFNGTTWDQVAKLTSSDAEDEDNFGWSVAIDSDVIVVGAYKEDGAGTDRGAVYVFEKPSNGWVDATEDAKLTASNTANSDILGYSVAVDSDVIVAGSPWNNNYEGLVYIYERSGSNWVSATEDAILSVSIPDFGDYFGHTVAIDSDVIVVGAYGEDGAGAARGAVYVYEKSGSNWVSAIEDAKLTASDTQDSDQFGIQVDIESNVIAVGSHLSASGGTQRGAVYVYERSGSNWITTTEDAKLTASDAQDSDRLGIAVSIRNNLILAGARVTNNRGAVYVYERSGSNWITATEDVKFTSSDIEDSDGFSYYSLDLSSTMVLVGASGEDDPGTNSGAAYIYQILTEPYVRNLSPSSISSNSTKINYLVSDGGSLTNYSILYGTTTGDFTSTIEGSSYQLSANSGTTSLNLTLSGLSPLTNYFYQVTAWNSSGTTTSLKEYFTTLNYPDTDGDGIFDSDENEAPNSGDGNGDGIQDANQNYVASVFSNVSGYYQTVVCDASVTLAEVEQVDTESRSDYTFPFGAIKFTLASSATTVKIYYHGVSNLSNYIYRKKRFGDSWFNFSDVEFGSEIVNGTDVATVTLTLDDGDIEDYDGQVNGVIVDPGGPVVPLVANIPVWDEWWFLIAVLMIVGIVFKFRN